MKKRILNYVNKTEKKLKENIPFTEKEKNYHLIQIEQFQHERLIHLLVTIFTGTISILFLLFGLTIQNITLLILFIISLCLFIPYILHYYLLENNVQKMYEQYDKIISNQKES